MRKRRRSCSGGLGWRGQPLAMLGWVVRGWRGRFSCGRRRGPTACVPARVWLPRGATPQAYVFIYAPDCVFCALFCDSILLGLLAKIKCSICSYQFNIWYTGHCLVDINLIFGLGELSQFTGGFRALAMDLHPSMAEASNHQTKISSAPSQFTYNSPSIGFASARASPGPDVRRATFRSTENCN